MAESYLVPAGYGEGRYEDRKSKFIGDLYFVESQEQAIELLNEVKAKYRDARHHCYAYIIREGNYMRYSDDGEPQGTAGGLVRAYTKSTQLALENAGINEVNRYAVVLITCPYSLLGTVQNLLPEHNCIVEETDYAADVTLTATLPEDGTAALEQALRDATSANADMEIMDTQFMGRRIK